jgi:hypothetical protein
VFGNKVIRGIFCPSRDEIRKRWSYIMTSFLCFYFSPNSVRAVKSRMMGWEAHVAQNIQVRNIFTTVLENPKVRDYLTYPGLGGRVILKLRNALLLYSTGSREAESTARPL